MTKQVTLSKRFTKKFGNVSVKDAPLWALLAFATAKNLRIRYWLTIND